MQRRCRSIGSKRTVSEEPFGGLHARDRGRQGASRWQSILPKRLWLSTPQYRRRSKRFFAVMRGGVVSFQICFGGDKIFPFSSCRHFFLRSKLGVCRVRFEGNKGQTMRGKRQGFPPIKYTVKRQCNRKILSVAKALGAFGLDVTLIVC